MSQFQFVFDAEHPDLKSFEFFIQQLLESHQLAEAYKPEDIILIACRASENHSASNSASDSVITIQLSWLKTKCLEILQHENRQKFDRAVQALFVIENPDAQSFWSSVSRLLCQFRLNGTYDVKDIVVEAYAIGVRRIESGEVIRTPLAWLRTTFFNVIRDFRKKQDRLEHPKLDGEGLTPGDEALSDLIIAEDRNAMRLAFMQLSPEDRQVLCDRILKGLSWQAIGESLSRAEGVEVNANTARQRGFRALQKLRQAYETVRQRINAFEEDREAAQDCDPGAIELWGDDLWEGG